LGGSSRPFPLDFLAFVVLGVSITSFSSFLALKREASFKVSREDKPFRILDEIYYVYSMNHLKRIFDENVTCV